VTARPFAIRRAPSISWLLVLGVAVALLLPAGAEACAVCFGGEDSDWTTGFLLGTIVMLALPPAIIGGAGFAIYRAIKRHDAEVAASEAREPEPDAPRAV
jgi:hypothetical protein